MWEIFAYQNADSLFGIFNAVAAIRGADTYLGAVAGVAFCGFIAALLAYGFAPHKLQGWQWIASVVLVYSILFVPTVTVGVVDKTGGAPEKVVDNVPFGLAMFGGMTSAIGNAITELFETAFQALPGTASLPSELTYQKNGLLFGNRLIRDTAGVVFQDPNFRTDLVNFIHNCTMYDLIDGTLDPAAFSRSDEVWGMMATPNPARFTTLSTGGAVTTETCPDAYNNLNTRIPAQITLIQGKLAFQLNPTLPAAAASAVIANEIQQAYLKNSIATAAATAADIIRQNAVINAINDASKIIGQKINDPASMILAVGQAQAVAQTNAAWIANGKIAEQALPVVRNVVEALAYALFPIVVLLLFLTSGRDTAIAVKNYVGVLIWIQLWPPLYAILNYMACIYAASELSAAADVGGAKALSLLSASPIFSGAVSSQAMVGYLTMSIPFIAWAALRRMENFGQTVVGGLAGLQAAAASATGAAAVGNVSMGNVAMDQMQLAPNRTSSFMHSWQDDITGNTISSNVLNGRTGVSLLRNQGFASRVVSMRISEQDVTDASRQADAARSEAVTANAERSAVLTEAFTRGLAKYHSSRSSGGTSSSSFEQTGENLDRLDQITKEVSDRTGISQSQVAQIAFGASGHLGGNTAFAGAQLQSNSSKNYQTGLSANQQKVLGTLTSEQIAEFKQFGNRMTRDSAFVNTIASDSKEANEMSSRLSAATTRSARADAAYAERLAYSERMSAARERGEAISLDIAQDPHNVEMFMRYAEQYGGDSSAALTLFEAELARQSLRPNRVFTDGSARPTSFDDVRAQHDKTTTDSRLAPDTTAIDTKHRAQVSSAHSSIPSSTGAPHPTDIRHDIEAQGSEIRRQTSSANQEFDKNSEVTKAPDGTLESKKSLMKQSGKQVEQDATSTFDNAKNTVKDFLNRK